MNACDLISDFTFFWEKLAALLFWATTHCPLLPHFYFTYSYTYILDKQTFFIIWLFVLRRHVKTRPLNRAVVLGCDKSGIEWVAYEHLHNKPSRGTHKGHTGSPTDTVTQSLSTIAASNSNWKNFILASTTRK